MEKRTKSKDFLKFLSSTRGDLANITAPPYFLAPVSVVEILIALKSQFYIAGDPSTSIKKPLNAFLAVYMWDDEYGISGEGYTRVEMTFSGAVDIKQIGHAVVHIDRYNEDYLIPLPNARVKGFLSGRLYPELYGTYHIVTSSGYICEMRFEGQGLLWGGKRNTFEAIMYRRGDEEKRPIYMIDGQWSGEFTIRNAAGDTLEVYNTNDKENSPKDAKVAHVDEQDP